MKARLEEYAKVKSSAEVRSLVDEVCARGAELGYTQKTIASATYLVYKLVSLSLEGRRETMEFESISSLVLGLLNLTGKSNGYCRRACKAVKEAQERGSGEDRKKRIEDISAIYVGKIKVIVFRHNKECSQLEAHPETLLRTEVLIAMLLGFDFNVPDFYGQLWKKSKKLSMPPDTSKVSWIVLSDSFRLPLSLYFGMGSLVQACVRLGKMIAEEAAQEIGELSYGYADLDFIEKEIVGLYADNQSRAAG